MNFYNVQAVLDSIIEKEFSGGGSPEAIKHAESEIGFKFPLDYAEYLTELGCGFAFSEDFIGLGGEEHLDVLCTYRRLRQISKHTQLPINFVPLKPDGYGNFECIDIGNSSEDKSLVVLWLHDSGDEQNCEILSHGFWEWFAKELESIQDFDEQGQ